MLAVMAVGCRLGGVAHRGLLVALLRLVQAPRGSLVAHRAGHVAVGKVPHRRRMLALLSLVQRRGCGGVPCRRRAVPATTRRAHDGWHDRRAVVPVVPVVPVLAVVSVPAAWAVLVVVIMVVPGP